MKDRLANIGTIVVPVDFSQNSRAAIRFASKIARAHGADIHLVHAVDAFVHLSLASEVANRYREDRERAAADDLERLVAELGLEPGPSLHVTWGEASEVLSTVAREVAADLIVMGKRGAAGASVLGSVTQRLVRDGEWPVMLVSPEQLPDEELVRFTRPVVAVDYSQMSRAAVGVAARLVEPGATVELIHVIEATRDVLGEPMLRELQAARDQDLQTLQEFAGALDIAEVVANTQNEVGRVIDAILSFVESSAADLVVAGAHGRNDGTPTIGTVASRLATQSPVPVVLIPGRSSVAS